MAFQKCGFPKFRDPSRTECRHLAVVPLAYVTVDDIQSLVGIYIRPVWPLGNDRQVGITVGAAHIDTAATAALGVPRTTLEKPAIRIAVELYVLATSRLATKCHATIKGHGSKLCRFGLV